MLWRGIGVNYEGGVLDAAARSGDPDRASHRRVGRVRAISAGSRSRLARVRLRAHGFALDNAALLMQVALGIGNVKLGLPLPVATAHNGVAALLLFALIALLVRTHAEHQRFSWNRLQP